MNKNFMRLTLCALLLAFAFQPMRNRRRKFPPVLSEPKPKSGWRGRSSFARVWLCRR